MACDIKIGMGACVNDNYTPCFKNPHTVHSKACSIYEKTYLARISVLKPLLDKLLIYIEQKIMEHAGMCKSNFETSIAKCAMDCNIHGNFCTDLDKNVAVKYIIDCFRSQGIDISFGLTDSAWDYLVEFSLVPNFLNGNMDYDSIICTAFSKI